MQTLTSPTATLRASSVTQPAAILAAPAVCNSLHIVSESTPMPPHGNITKLLMGSSAKGQMKKI